MRRANEPPCRRANRALYSAVDAVPRCATPVGLGAMRTRTFAASGTSICYVPRARKLSCVFASWTAGRRPTPGNLSIPRGPGSGAEAGVASCARSVGHLRDALPRVLVVSLAPAVHASNTRRISGRGTLWDVPGVLALAGGNEFNAGNEEQDRVLAQAAGAGPAYLVPTAAARQRPASALAHAQAWVQQFGLQLE